MVVSKAGIRIKSLITRVPQKSQEGSPALHLIPLNLKQSIKKSFLTKEGLFKLLFMMSNWDRIFYDPMCFPIIKLIIFKMSRPKRLPIKSKILLELIKVSKILEKLWCNVLLQVFKITKKVNKIINKSNLLKFWIRIEVN